MNLLVEDESKRKHEAVYGETFLTDGEGQNFDVVPVIVLASCMFIHNRAHVHDDEGRIRNLKV